MPNNREWAIFFWLGLLLTSVCLKQSTVRRSLADVVETFVRPPLSPAWALMATWVVGEVWLAMRLSAWDVQLTTDTVLWFLTSALVIFMNLNEAGRRHHYFARKAVDAFTITALIQAYVSLVSLNIIAEFIFQPFIITLAVLAAVAATKTEYRVVQTFISSLLAVSSVALISYVTVTLVTTWGNVDKPELLRQLGLPVWLTIGLLPYAFLLAVYIAYRGAFFHLAWANGCRQKPTWRERGALVLMLHLRLRAVSRFVPPWPQRFAAATSFMERRRVIRDFLAASVRRND